MVMKSEHSDHRLQAHLYGDECQAHVARVEADLAEEYPVAFKRDLLALIQALSRFIDDSIVSPRLLYPSPSDPISYLCLSIGQDPQLAGRLLDYLKVIYPASPSVHPPLRSGLNALSPKGNCWKRTSLSPPRSRQPSIWRRSGRVSKSGLRSRTSLTKPRFTGWSS